MNRIALWSAVSIMCFAPFARAADAPAGDWPKLEGLDFTQHDAKAGQIAVVPAAAPAKAPARDAADLNFQPFQINHGQLTFAVPLAAHEKKQLFLYTAPSRLNLPGFPPKTGYDNRHAYRS